MKRRVVRRLQRYLLKPPIRLLLALRNAPPGYALLETTGRVSGRAVGRRSGTGWSTTRSGSSRSIVTRSGYVHNLEADPRVRVKVRRGLRGIWRSGSAHVVDADHPIARQRALGRAHPTRVINTRTVRAMGTELLTIRIDLDPC